MAEGRRLNRRGPGCLEGLFKFLALNQKLQTPKLIAYQKHGEGNDNTLRVKVPKPINGIEKEETVQETDSVSPTTKASMFTWKTLMFRKKTHKKDQKKIESHSNPRDSSPSSSRLIRSSSIHHSKCFEYVVPDELALEYQRMNESSSTETGSSQGAPQSSHQSPRGPVFQESRKASGSISGKHNLIAEAPCETIPENLTTENEVSSKQKSLDDSTHHSKEFLDFLELFNAHRELFLKILHDPSLLVPPEQQEQEASSSGAVPLSKLESFPRPGGSSGKRNPIFDRSDSEKSRRAEIQRSPSRPKSDLEGVKVISTRMPSGVEASTVSLAESRSLKKAGTTSSRFKAISKKIKHVVKDGVFHKMPYGQKMAELTKSTSTKKFAQEEKQIRRSYSIAESVDKYSTLYDSMSRESRISFERPSTAVEDDASLRDKKSPMHMKRITSLPEMELYAPQKDALTEFPGSQIVPKTYDVESDRFSSHQNGSFSIVTEGNLYPDYITERTADIYSEQNDEEGAFLCSLEEDLRSILRTPSSSSFGQSFSHRRINSLPSFDRTFFQDHSRSFTEHSVADSEPTFEDMQLEDDEWLVKPSQASGEYAANFKNDQWLIRPLQPSGIDATDHEDEEWVVETPQLLGANAVEDEEWLVKPALPLGADDSNSEFQFIHEFTEQNDAGSLHIYVNDENEADFQYVKDILKKSGFSCGEADWYASNQPLSPVIFEEAECSCQDLEMTNDEPHSIVRRMLLFDIINEVLMHIYDSSLVNGPWHSRFDPRTRPIPMGSHVLEEVWENVSCYLSLQWKPNTTVDDIVAHDVMRKDSWMNLLYDAECVALDLEDLMVEDLLDDVVLQIVLISIDE
ncbi:hypothetical protein VPH35_088631 [Triticum aestivum]|uniref:DUF4378 domain-containing protein n=2 Tax=Triticum TaxID=4564 RepID=A0A9R0X1A8_TRITD|nr:uncharacterized protein LOC123110689 isoform X1 [Triticum aestivum]VAI28236.1 unnamed protein product [Triticum turgidum subsp. durum]